MVVDAEHVFVSSANFTEAGQDRNIEVGLNIRSEWLARQLIKHFKHLYEHEAAGGRHLRQRVLGRECVSATTGLVVRVSSRQLALGA